MRQIRLKLSYVDNFSLQKIRRLVSDTYNHCKYQNEKIQQLSRNININYIIQKSILTNEEAVIYAAKFYFIDIRRVTRPMEFLDSFIRDKLDCEDPFVRRFNYNKNYFKLDKIWKEDIKYLYSSKTIENLKDYENCSTELELTEKINTDNFYHGDITFSDIENQKEIVSWGCISKSENIKILRLSDILQDFKRDLSFGKYQKSILKLYNICKEYGTPTSEDVRRIIIYIQRFGEPYGEHVRKIKKVYSNQSTIIDRTLEILKEIGDLSDKQLIMESRKKLITFLDNILDPEIKSVLNEIRMVEYLSSKFRETGRTLRDTLQNQEMEVSVLYKYTSYYYCYVLTGKKNFSLD